MMVPLLKSFLRKSYWHTKNRILPLLASKYRINYKNRGEINFVDIGSVGGLPSPWLSNANRIRRLVNFEPNETPKTQGPVTTLDAALWSGDEEREFYIYRGMGGTGSSLFRQNFSYVKEHWDELKLRGPQKLAESWFERSQLEKTIRIKCRSLDNVLREYFPDEEFHFLKIDAQGAEFEILQGAQEMINRSCVGLEMELFTVPLYEGIHLLEDVRDWLEQKGFELVQKAPPHGTFHSQHNCLFLHESRSRQIRREIAFTYQIGLHELELK